MNKDKMKIKYNLKSYQTMENNTKIQYDLNPVYFSRLILHHFCIVAPLNVSEVYSIGSLNKTGLFNSFSHAVLEHTTNPKPDQISVSEDLKADHTFSGKPFLSSPMFMFQVSFFKKNSEASDPSLLYYSLDLYQ